MLLTVGGSGFFAWEGFVGVSVSFALVVNHLPFGSPAICRGEAWERSATLPVATKIAAHLWCYLCKGPMGLN